MGEINYFQDSSGANWTESNEREYELSLQRLFLFDYTDISENSFFGVIAYCVIFTIASIGHTFSFSHIWKEFLDKKSRIILLLLHLSIADLIVCLIIVPTEVFWRLSVQWEGGNFLCKATQFFRAFSLYLSSLVLICLTIDRFISIILKPEMIGTVAYRRVKWMVSVAWIVAGFFSIPQTILFRVESHPNFPDFKQCITSEPHDPRKFFYVKLYSVFSLAVMYLVPLVVIVFTYSIIFFKLIILSRDLSRSNLPTVIELDAVPGPTMIDDGISVDPIMPPTLQQDSNVTVQSSLSVAKIRTLQMTIVIIMAFIACWTPYAVMTLWYIVDWEGAKKVDPKIQDALFLMVVANSCVNPLIYSGFRRKNKVCGRKSSST